MRGMVIAAETTCIEAFSYYSTHSRTETAHNPGQVRSGLDLFDGDRVAGSVGATRSRSEGRSESGTSEHL
jgi:hypothetical protein